MKRLTATQWALGNLYLWYRSAPASTRLFSRVTAMTNALMRVAREPAGSPRHTENVAFLQRQASHNLDEIRAAVKDMRDEYDEYRTLFGKKRSLLRHAALAVMHDKVTTAMYQQQLADLMSQAIKTTKGGTMLDDDWLRMPLCASGPDGDLLEVWCKPASEGSTMRLRDDGELAFLMDCYGIADDDSLWDTLGEHRAYLDGVNRTVMVLPAHASVKDAAARWKRMVDDLFHGRA